MGVNVERLPGGVAVVTLLAESAQNAFSIKSIKQISETLYSLIDDDEISAYVLTGSGKFFCAGADINEFRSCYDDGTIADLVSGLTDILHPLLVKYYVYYIAHELVTNNYHQEQLHLPPLV